MKMKTPYQLNIGPLKIIKESSAEDILLTSQAALLILINELDNKTKFTEEIYKLYNRQRCELNVLEGGTRGIEFTVKLQFVGSLITDEIESRLDLIYNPDKEL